MKTNYLLLSMAIAAVVTGCQTTAPTIHLAAGSGRLDLVKREVSKGVSVNLNAGNFGTPLHQAAMLKRVMVADWLIANGAAVDSRTHIAGTTPLHEAALRLDEPMVKLLLDLKANPNLLSSNGLAPLHMTLSKTGDVQTVSKMLVEGGADPNLLSRGGLTPFHKVALRGDVELIQHFLDHGARIDEPATNGATALMLASRLGRKPAVELLLSRQADPEKRDATGATALIGASAHGKTETCALLLRAGGRFDAADNLGGTPLAYALRNSHFKAAVVLIDAGATYPIAEGTNSSDQRFWSALYEKLLADKQCAEAHQQQANLHYDAALKSLSALRDEFVKTAKSDIRKAAGKELAINLLAALAGAAVDVGGSYAQYSNYRTMAQVSAL